MTEATAYTIEPWSDLFVAAAGASAALAGLVFVAVSINVERILSFAGLPERALATVMLLLSVVLVALVGLIPGQGHVVLGLELLGLALGFAVLIFCLVQVRTDVDDARSRAGRIGLMLAGTVPFVVGGLSLLLETGGGLYWIAGGLVVAITGGVANAWVLLVEILR